MDNVFKAKIIKQAFDPYIKLPLKEWEILSTSALIRSFKKETIIKESDKIEKCLNIIISGSVCILIWNENNFICTDLLFDNEIALDYLSFITQQVSPYEVRTMEDTEMLTVSYNDFERFTKQSGYGDKIWRYATQALYIDKHHQQIQLLTMTATQRYHLAIKHQGELFQRIPQKFIASYLGITQQSLSRLRRKTR
jgi:CRP-like cAMP-binding protein